MKNFKGVKEDIGNWVALAMVSEFAGDGITGIVDHKDLSQSLSATIKVGLGLKDAHDEIVAIGNNALRLISRQHLACCDSIVDELARIRDVMYKTLVTRIKGGYIS